jgi:hypothetical protein
MIIWWLALNSYPHTYPHNVVDESTHRVQSLTDCQDPSLYLKDNILKIKINKKINIKNLLVIPMSILILTLSTTPAKAVSQTDLLKLYAHSRLVSMEQFSCFEALITKESNWRVDAKNGSHYGLGQMKNQTYRRLDGFNQIDWSIRYITKRYGSMCNAWRFFKEHKYH